MRVAMPVLYRLSETDVAEIEHNRSIYQNAEPPAGVQIHRGNPVKVGQPFLMIVTAVWAEEFPGNEPPYGLNGQVILDGNDTLWVTSREHGEQPGQWCEIGEYQEPVTQQELNLEPASPQPPAPSRDALAGLGYSETGSPAGANTVVEESSATTQAEQ